MAANTTLTAKVGADTRDFRRGMAQANSSLDGLRRTAAGMRNIVIGVGLGAGAKSAASFLGGALGQASDLNETIAKTGQVFGANSEAIRAWAKSSSSALVASQAAVLDTVAGFDLLLGNKGINGTAGIEMSKRLTDLSADLASFFNTSQADAADAISSALRGEMDPIERFGVSLNDAALKAEAFRLGMYKGKGVLDDTAKAQAAYSLLLRQTSKAQGDLRRTQGGYANQVRQLKTNYDGLKTSIGQVFIPLAEKYLPKINALFADLISEDSVRLWQLQIIDIAERIESWAGGFGGAKDGLRGLVDALTGFARDAAPALDGIGEVVGGIVSAFNNLSPETKQNLGLIIAAGAAFKLAQTNPVVKIGVSMTSEVVKGAAGALGSQLVQRLFLRPLPVIVMNPGFSAPGSPTNRNPKGGNSKGGAVTGGLVGLGLTAAAWAAVQAIPADWTWNDRSIADRAQRAMNYTALAAALPMPPVVKAALVPIVGLVGFLKDEWERQQVTMNEMHDRLERSQSGYPTGGNPVAPPAYPSIPIGLSINGGGTLGRIVPARKPAPPTPPPVVNVLLDGRLIARHVAPRHRPMSGPRLSLIGA